MFKYYIFILFFFNLSFNAYANYKSDPITHNVYKYRYLKCMYDNIEKKHKLAVYYDTDVYLPSVLENKKKTTLECNKYLEELIDNKYHSDDKGINFKKLVNDAIINNIDSNKDLYLFIYLKYHFNIINYSDDFNLVKKHLNEIENNYINRLDLKINPNGALEIGLLGWKYNTKVNFIDFDKAKEYLTKAVKYEKRNHYKKHWINNLGVVYDQGYSDDITNKNHIKQNNKIAFDLYKQSASLGLHYSHHNIAKFYMLGLGGVKQNYDKAIKHYKFARISSNGSNEFIDLAILYKKKRVPKNLDEYLMWLEDYIIKNQDNSGFQQIAWLMDENEKIDDISNVYNEMYKWQYLCSKLCDHEWDKDRSISEMHIYEKILSKEQIERAKLNAIKWEDKNWNKPIDTNVNEILENKKKTLTEIIRKALIKK